MNPRNRNALDWAPANRSDVAPVLDRIPNGSFILTSGHADVRAGVSVKWAQQCSSNPPMVMVAVPKGHVLSPLIRDSRSFAICQLDPTDRTTSRAFDLQTPGIDPFIGSTVDRTPSGCPVPARALSFLDCELARHVDLDGDYELYVGIVHHATTILDPHDQGAMLVRFRNGATRASWQQRRLLHCAAFTHQRRHSGKPPSARARAHK